MSIFSKKKNEINEEPIQEPVNESTPEIQETGTIGSRIAQARKAKGYTQEEFSQLLGVTAQAVSKWENDISCPDIQLLPKIAEIMGMTLDELITGKTPCTTEVKEAPKPVDTSKLKFTINISKPDQRPVVVSLPFSAAKKFTRIGNGISGIVGNGSLSSDQIEEILSLVENGATGEVFRVEADDETVIKFIIE